MKDGSTGTVDYLATRVYEKIDGRWVMVFHHAQPKPLYGCNGRSELIIVLYRGFAWQTLSGAFAI